MGLTPKQHLKLDAVADEDPGARVVGNFGNVRMAGGSTCQIPIIERGDGTRQRVMTSGRLGKAELAGERSKSA